MLITQSNVAASALSPAPIANGSTGAASAQAPALPAVAGRLNYLEGFDLSGGGATAASVIVVTVTGLLAGTLTFDVAVAAGVSAPAFGTAATAEVLQVRFPSPLPASNTNTAITLNVPSFGAGNTAAAAVVYGLLQ